MPAEVPTVLGNAGQIEQVLLNVCLNARDAILESDRGEPRLRVEFSVPAPGRVSVSVTDNGVGMTEAVSAAHIRAIFHHQGNGARDRPRAV